MEAFKQGEWHQVSSVNLSRHNSEEGEAEAQTRWHGNEDVSGT